MGFDFDRRSELEQGSIRRSTRSTFRKDALSAEEDYERELKAAILDFRFGPEEIPRLRRLRVKLEVDEVQRIHARSLDTLFPANAKGLWVREHRRFLNACLQRLE